MSIRTIPVAVFRLGNIVVTPNVLETIAQDDVLTGIQRHQAGDWGDLPEVNREANDRALVQGRRILSAYRASTGTRFWIITEADRSFTTVLLPEDY
jgi:hypothetical protein